MVNWEDYEKAHALDFSPIRQEFVTGCQICGARIVGSDEKRLAKRRKQHSQLHFYHAVYVKNLTDRVGVPSEPDGKLFEYLNTMIRQLAEEMHGEFKLYLRFMLDEEKIWDRLRVQQKSNLEYELRKKWDSLGDKEKSAFIKFAKEFIETAFPEFKEPEPVPVPQAATNSHSDGGRRDG